MAINTSDISIILPAKNEQEGLAKLLPELLKQYPDAEIILVDDGSEDETVNIAKQLGNINVVSHPYAKGNGAAIKTGIRAATRKILVFMDADGQHMPGEINLLLEKMVEGHDMVVGARSSSSQATFGRYCANSFYNWFSSLIVGQKIEDLTSGFRVAKTEKIREFLYLFPNGFSYPTTCTMAFFRSGYSVGYVPVNVKKRIGKSHIRIFRDGVRFLLILFKIGTLYSPLKIFFPISAATFLLGLMLYMYTYITIGRFTNMSALLFTTSVTIFLMGLVSEQITMLLYQHKDSRD